MKLEVPEREMENYSYVPGLPGPSSGDGVGISVRGSNVAVKIIAFGTR